MSGHLGYLNAPQLRALAQLKQAVADVHCPRYDDYYYLRWLRARNFDPTKAETMMRKDLAFRKKIEADTLLKSYTPPMLLDKYYPRSYLGPDKEGCPVRLMPFKYLDLKGFVYSIRKIEVLKFLAYLFEKDIEEMDLMSLKKGIVIEKHSYILDLEGYSFRQATNKDGIDMFNDILKLYESCYPERMKVVYFINAPIYFSVILNLSKPFLSENTLQKFRVYGRDFKRALLADIDAEILPKYLGGKRTDPDGNPMCKTIINFGGMIPREHYIMNSNIQSIQKEPGVNIKKVSSHSTADIDIMVSEANTRLEWTIETSSRDIAFGLYFKRHVLCQKTEEILSLDRISCHLVPESGAFTCVRAGIYILRFCNSYSWITSKKVYYKYKLVRPGEHHSEEDLL